MNPRLRSRGTLRHEVPWHTLAECVEYPGKGKCHGSQSWCDQCGDVYNTCDDGNCDVHRKNDK